MITSISYMAAILTTVSFIPQAVMIIKTKNTSGISLGMYLTFTIGVAFWTIYGILAELNAVIFANAITLVFASIILGYKINNNRKVGQKAEERQIV